MDQTIINIGNPETGERYQLDLNDERARPLFMDHYKPAGFVLYDRDGGKPDAKSTRELVRAITDERAKASKAASPADTKAVPATEAKVAGNKGKGD